MSYGMPVFSTARNWRICREPKLNWWSISRLPRRLTMSRIARRRPPATSALMSAVRARADSLCSARAIPGVAEVDAEIDCRWIGWGKRPTFRLGVRATQIDPVVDAVKAVHQHRRTRCGTLPQSTRASAGVCGAPKRDRESPCSNIRERSALWIFFRPRTIDRDQHYRFCLEGSFGVTPKREKIGKHS